ncbi:hypothetical protein NSZ01_01650 [Nocardioides szechwanensis]|uniref:Uncharacterized protein n=1 Tax=Nocardioides szechwanensis TaxID=1005944 RepID=A0A1G9X8N1_9ACTN|nr:hypothetical protein [Nocardioides szechwanensis]GEP32397.1 hypothetical protein NSZ01_01650 [Nocardioides szechwanensis]SDM92861.1 hypothetical protein SAMN05192576_1289 [Nocardioides szechwanensis]
MTATVSPTDVDPFDLPDWLGESEVTWSADTGLRTGHLVPGRLTGPSDEDAVACDLLAVDEAYPAPVTDSALRSRAHQSWQHGQILLAAYDGRLTLLVPGTGFDADRVLVALERLARAVGAAPASYAAHLRLGR